MGVHLHCSAIRGNFRALLQIFAALSKLRLQIGHVRFEWDEVLIRLQKLAPPVLTIGLHHEHQRPCEQIESYEIHLGSIWDNSK